MARRQITTMRLPRRQVTGLDASLPYSLWLAASQHVLLEAGVVRQAAEQFEIG